MIALLAALAMLPSLYSGITSGNDMAQHYQFAVTAYDSLVSGQIYPSIAGTMNHGLGDVSFRFYPPLSYYVLASVYLLVHDWYIASLFSFFLVFFVGGTGVYLWAKEEFSSAQSLLAAGIFIFAPFHLNEIYNNFLLAEFSASAIIPFCFLFLTRVVRRGGLLDVLGLAISYALLVLTHLPSTVICSIALLIHGLVLLKSSPVKRSLLNLSIAVTLGLAMSSFYWLRMLTEIDWVKHSGELYSSGIWGYQTNFLFAPGRLINFQDDSLNLWLADLMLLAMLLLSVPTIVFLVRKRTQMSSYVSAVLAVFVLTVFMTSPLSEQVWANVSFLQKVQFPWRWLAVLSGVGSVFASIGLFKVSDALKNSRSIVLPIAIGSMIIVYVFTSAVVVKGAVYNSRDGFNLSIENLNGRETFEGWWPTWAQPAAFSREQKISLSGRENSIVEWTPSEKEFVVQPGVGETAAVAALYYPHWTASINGRPVPVSPTETGLITIEIPPELSQVDLKFEEPLKIKAAFGISGLAWLTTVILVIIGLASGRRKEIN